MVAGKFDNKDIVGVFPKTSVLSSQVVPVSSVICAKESWNSKSFHHSSNNFKVLPFNLSDIGEGIAEVTVKEWYVEVGSKVNQFDSICEVQSDKASVTITSKYDGVIKKIYYEIDEIARVGTTLVDIEISDDNEAEVNEEYEHLLDSEPGTPPLPAQQDPSVRPVLPLVTPETKAEPGVPKIQKDSKKSLAAPAVRRLAMEYNLNLNDISGSGRDGRILKEDVLLYIANKPQEQATQKTQIAQDTPAAPAITQRVEDVAELPRRPPAVSVDDKVEKLTGIRKAMVKSMRDALNIPHFGYCDEISADSLIRVRQELKAESEKYGVKLSFMPFFIKATSMALEKYPILNSTLDEENFTVTHKGQHNVCVAMDTDKGLIVPNVKDVQSKSVLEIAAELNELHRLGLAGKLGPDHLTGGTISLSNIGSIGGTYAKPVVLPPQVAIAAIGKVQTVPRFDNDGKVYAANIFNISWSADHRVVEGAIMAKYSNLWKSFVENPCKMLLTLR